MALNAGTAYIDVKGRMDQFQRDVQTGVRGAMSRVGAGAVALGRGLTRSVTLPLVGLGTVASRTFMGFEESMSRIVGLVGIAEDEVAKMGEAILELAPKVGRGPGELAEALFTITSAGMEGAEAMEVLEVAAKAATAGLGETRSIAEALTGAMNAYGPEALTAARATEIIVATARAGNFATEDLAGSLGRVTPFAKEAGASFEDVGGAIALLTRVNNDARQSVTQVGAALRAFAAPTAQTRKALGELELSTDQMREMMGEKGLVGTLRFLDERLEGNRDRLREIIPDSQGFSAALQILNADAETIEGTFGSVADSAGIVGEAFDAAADTSRFKFDQLKAQLEGIFINLGAAILPVVIPIFQKVAEFLGRVAEAFDRLSPSGKRFAVVVGLIAAAAGPVLLIIGKLLIVLAGISAPVLIAIGVIAGLVAGIMAAVRWFNSGSERAEALKAKLIEFRDQSLIPLRDAFLELWERVKEAWPEIRAQIVSALDAGKEAFDAVLPLMARMIDSLRDILRVAGPVAIEVGKFVLAFQLGTLRAAANAIGAIARAIGNVLDALGRVPTWARFLFPAPAAAVGALRGRGESETSSALARQTRGLPGVTPRAHGGPVAAGRSYWVGERGVELFTPAAAGHITPNHQLAAGGGMGGDVYLDGDRVGRWVARDLETRRRGR